MTRAHGTLAVDGGAPVRAKPLPYARHEVTKSDERAVLDALRSDWLTTGPRVGSFEAALARATGAAHAVVVNNGTSALIAAYAAIGVGPGDEVILPPMTFVATANAARILGARPVFADVDADTLLLSPATVARRISPRTKAIVAVDLCGQPADYASLQPLAEDAGATLVADACHALGARDERGRAVGSIAALSTFSFHPAKHITTLEGGAITCSDPALAQRMRVFRNHGITLDTREREQRGAFSYEQTSVGLNLRLSDVQCALGESQLARLSSIVERRRAIAARFDDAFRGARALAPLATRPGVSHAHHLYVVRLDLDPLRVGRDAVIAALRAEGIGATLHYPPVHLQPAQRDAIGAALCDCPVAEQAGVEILTLPLFAAMTERDTQDVIDAVDKVLAAYLR